MYAKSVVSDQARGRMTKELEEDGCFFQELFDINFKFGRN